MTELINICVQFGKFGILILAVVYLAWRCLVWRRRFELLKQKVKETASAAMSRVFAGDYAAVAGSFNLVMDRSDIDWAILDREQFASVSRCCTKVVEACQSGDQEKINKAIIDFDIVCAFCCLRPFRQIMHVPWQFLYTVFHVK